MNTNHVVKLMLSATDQVDLALPPEGCPPGGEVEPAEKLHITLAFLGKHAPAKAVEDAIAMLAMILAPLRLHVRAPNRFMFPKRDVIYLPVDGDDIARLRLLRSALVQCVEEVGAKVDTRFDGGLWTPHVTLARVPSGTLLAGPLVTTQYLEDLPREIEIKAISYKMGANGTAHFAMCGARPGARP